MCIKNNFPCVLRFFKISLQFISYSNENLRYLNLLILMPHLKTKTMRNAAIEK